MQTFRLLVRDANFKATLLDVTQAVDGKLTVRLGEERIEDATCVRVEWRPDGLPTAWIERPQALAGDY